MRTKVGTEIDITDTIADTTIEIMIDTIIGEVMTTIIVFGKVEVIMKQIGEAEEIQKVHLMTSNMIIEEVKLK